MTTLRLIVDRRSQGSKSTVNRNRLLGRIRGYAQDALQKRIKEGNIEDINESMDVSVPRDDLMEPEFQHGSGGVRDFVLPGNKEYVRGDKLPKPKGGKGSGGGNPSADGESQDDFIFRLSPEEFLKLFFEDMELPNMEDTAMRDIKSTERSRAGLTADGVALDLLRSVMKKKMRKFGSRGRLKNQLDELEKELRRMLDERVNDSDDQMIEEVWKHIGKMKNAVSKGIKFDPSDLRFKHFELRPKQVSQAVMFMIMDVSGSMDERRKELAKRFFMLLYWFLTSKYEHVVIVPIRHTSDAEEVDQETFFYDTKSGGTVVISAMKKAKEIIDARYSPSDWNSYVAQASDGDAFDNDATETAAFIDKHLFPLIRYMVYVEVGNGSSSLSELMKAYEKAKFPKDKFGMRPVESKEDVFPALHGLFKKEVE